MEKALVGPCAGRFHRACALILCAMSSSCAMIDAILPSPRLQVQKNIAQWQAAGGPAVVGCREDPFGRTFDLKTPAPSVSIAPQAYPSLRDFSSAAAAAQAPIQECVVISGSDDAAQIARAGWGSFGYVPLRSWRPADAYIEWQWTSEVAMTPMPGMEKFYKYSGPPTTYETSTFSERTTVPYGAWYLAYQRIPQSDEQAKRSGTGLYAMQGFRCAIHMRDFPAARRYWALALDRNPGSAAAYAQVALQSILQIYFNNVKNDSGRDYLTLPQDIRRAVWDAAGQRYSGRSMDQIEDAAQAGTLNKILSQADLRLPHLSLLYCPAFYPDFDPIPITNVGLWFRFPAYMLIPATQRAAGTAGREQ